MLEEDFDMPALLLMFATNLDFTDRHITVKVPPKKGQI